MPRYISYYYCNTIFVYILLWYLNVVITKVLRVCFNNSTMVGNYLAVGFFFGVCKNKAKKYGKYHNTMVHFFF